MNDISDSVLETTIDLLTTYFNIVSENALLLKNKEINPGITQRTIRHLKEAQTMRKEYYNFTTEQKIMLIKKDLKKIIDDLGKVR